MRLYRSKCTAFSTLQLVDGVSRNFKLDSRCDEQIMDEALAQPILSALIAQMKFKGPLVRSSVASVLDTR